MSTPLAQGSQVRVIAGLEIADSGTRLTAMASTAPSSRRWHVRLTAPPTPDEAVTQVAALLAQMQRDLSTGGLAAVGIALQGRVDASGVTIAVRQAPDWSGYPLAARLAERLHVPVRVESAVHA